MPQKQIPTKALHRVPKDLKSILDSNPSVLEKWDSLTPLARNEWICWVTIVKQKKTREEHIARLKEDLLKGKRRPCCWPGCPHRNKNAAKYFK
ncbi:MAG: hypothetical protein COX80_05175 [Candidatus Magasanikbacteria bacterium CG_4_10_14_0_2_um_filter_33_14]|uniref:YdeI/OmpD-associated family protein n=1 Tax=Candidatus Magasanikbacteria bacterium CG_4_10_14_0_2_um_filter_33_14 TaxID=1974636 RepID=A0A2M7V888_9BACT|nr:MAG: hypothetical protein COX80_05175 [Candidatus Magasanikbacteria bacterium CG_4_10_14_0_2_um_filter_33_14]